MFLAGREAPAPALGNCPIPRGQGDSPKINIPLNLPWKQPPQTLTVRAPSCSVRITNQFSKKNQEQDCPILRNSTFPAGRAGTGAKRRAEPCAGTLGIPEAYIIVAKPVKSVKVI